MGLPNSWPFQEISGGVHKWFWDGNVQHFLYTISKIIWTILLSTQHTDILGIKQRSHSWGIIHPNPCSGIPYVNQPFKRQSHLDSRCLSLRTTCRCGMSIHTPLTFPLELLLVHETTTHSLSLPWYLSTVFTSTLEQQLTLASPWLHHPAASALVAWSSLPSQKLRLKELLCLICSSFSRMRFCCCLRGVMTPISPASKPNCNTNGVAKRKIFQKSICGCIVQQAQGLKPFFFSWTPLAGIGLLVMNKYTLKILFLYLDHS